MNYNWNWHIFWEPSPDAAGTYLDTLWSGLLWTIATSLSAWAIALVIGILVGVMRTFRQRLPVLLANAWIELFRNIPLLVQMFLWYFVVPELVPAGLGNWIKSLPNSSFVTAVICLGFFTSSRVAIQVSAGIQALPRGQALAALALGMTPVQAYRNVLLPMALRIIIPPLASEFLNIIKNSAVALTIGLMELTARARSMQEFSFQVFEAFTAATLLYIALNVVVVLLMHQLEKKFSLPGYVRRGGGAGGGH